MTADALKPFGSSVFAEMTQLANEHDAINLAQGFPDFDGPPEIIEAAIKALRSGVNQYSRSLGHPPLVRAISEFHQRWYDLSYDAEREVAVYNGATEGIACALLGLLNPADEVILFEPFYDSYPALVARTGARARFVTLRYPEFELPRAQLESLFNDRTRLLVLNTPHNPTGKVFTRAELEFIAGLCQQHDVDVLSDEVYEHIVFDGAEHVPMASIDGMRDRTLTLSSSGKTFSFTGWKVGWGTGPERLIAGAQSAHQFLTFCASTPLQAAIAEAISKSPDDYYSELANGYRQRRDLLCEGLRAAGFQPVSPTGTYFILTAFAGLWDGDDWSLAQHLAQKVGVAAIPPSVFYAEDVAEGRQLLRFAFCKNEDTLARAVERLARVNS